MSIHILPIHLGLNFTCLVSFICWIVFSITDLILSQNMFFLILTEPRENKIAQFHTLYDIENNQVLKNLN